MPIPEAKTCVVCDEIGGDEGETALVVVADVIPRISRAITTSRESARSVVILRARTLTQ